MYVPSQFCPCGEDIFHEHGANFYVSVTDAGKVGLLAGPYSTHAQTLNDLETTKNIAYRVNHRAWFYSFGTLAMKDGYSKPGLLNDMLKKEEEERKNPVVEITPATRKKRAKKSATV